MENRLLKNTFILAFIFVFSLLTNAQLENASNVRLDKFQDIYAAGSNIFTFNMGEKYGMQDLQVFDSNGKNLNSIIITSKIGYTFESIISLENSSVIFLSAKKSNILLTIDNKGKELKRLEWNDVSFKDAKLINIDGKAFYLAGSVKGDSPGFVVRKYNSTLEMAWKYENFPDKNKYFFELADANKNGDLAILYRIKNANYSLAFINNKGELVADKALALDKFTKYEPYLLKVNATNDVFLAAEHGLYDSKDLFSMKTALNLKTFSITGEEKKNQDFAYAKLVEKENLNKNIPIGLRVLDIINTNNELKLVCEQYSVLKRIVSETTSTSTTPTNVSYYDITLSDLYLLNTSNINGDYFRIWKPARNLSIKSLTSYESGFSICSKLERNNMFGYQYSENNNLVVRGFSQNLEYVNKFPSNKAYDVSTSRKYWGKPLSATKVYSNNQMLTANYSYSTGFGGKKDLNRNGVFRLNNNTVVYNYNVNTGNLEFYTYK